MVEIMFTKNCNKITIDNVKWFFNWRTWYALRQHGFNTMSIGDFFSKTDKDILKIKGIGKAALNDIRKAELSINYSISQVLK